MHSMIIDADGMSRYKSLIIHSSSGEEAMKWAEKQLEIAFHCHGANSPAVTSTVGSRLFPDFVRSGLQSYVQDLQDNLDKRIAATT